jgi:hypothetical protein
VHDGPRTSTTTACTTPAGQPPYRPFRLWLLAVTCQTDRLHHLSPWHLCHGGVGSSCTKVQLPSEHPSRLTCPHCASPNVPELLTTSRRTGCSCSWTASLRPACGPIWALALTALPAHHFALAPRRSRTHHPLSSRRTRAARHLQHHAALRPPSHRWTPPGPLTSHPQHPPLPPALAQLPVHAANRGGKPTNEAQPKVARSLNLAGEGGHAQCAWPGQPTGLLRSWAACPLPSALTFFASRKCGLTRQTIRQNARLQLGSTVPAPTLHSLAWTWHHTRAYLPATCRMEEPTMQVLPSSSCETYPGCPSTWHPQAHIPAAACCTASSSGAVTDSPSSTPTDQSDTVPSGAWAL